MPNVIEILQQNIIYGKRIVTLMLLNKPSPPKQVTEDIHEQKQRRPTPDEKWTYYVHAVIHQMNEMIEKKNVTNCITVKCTIKIKSPQ